jgi:hypothetical protein
MNSQSLSRDRFANTRWSMVMHLAGTESPAARDALGELAQRYWHPVYAYVRRSGHQPAVAKELTHTILQRLSRDNDTGPPASGHYRHFLLERVRSYLAGELAAPASAVVLEVEAPADLEVRYLRNHLESATPEDAFQRSFALVVLNRSLQRLRSEADETGHLEMYKALEPYLARDPGPVQCERIIAALHIRQMTLLMALKRLRQRLRELAAEELSDTVSTADELSSEQDALLAVLDDLTP